MDGLHSLLVARLVFCCPPCLVKLLAHALQVFCRSERVSHALLLYYAVQILVQHLKSRYGDVLTLDARLLEIARVLIPVNVRVDRLCRRMARLLPMLSFVQAELIRVPLNRALFASCALALALLGLMCGIVLCGSTVIRPRLRWCYQICRVSLWIILLNFFDFSLSFQA